MSPAPDKTPIPRPSRRSSSSIVGASATERRAIEGVSGLRTIDRSDGDAIVLFDQNLVGHVASRGGVAAGEIPTNELAIVRAGVISAFL